MDFSVYFVRTWSLDFRPGIPDIMSYGVVRECCRNVKDGRTDAYAEGGQGRRKEPLIPYPSFRYVPEHVTIANLLQNTHYGDFKVFSTS
ncbi:hypothetical protein J6590_080181 [Homalodisca vitripennis]|nr:hypothetical protein J6590_080181 [Homalodisca vitripennis]